MLLTKSLAQLTVRYEVLYTQYKINNLLYFIQNLPKSVKSVPSAAPKLIQLQLGSNLSLSKSPVVQVSDKNVIFLISELYQY